MTPAQSLKLKIYFFTQFMSGGAAHAYAGLWLKERGLDSWQIGVVGTLPIVIILLSNVFVGRIADRAKDWKQVIVIGTVVTFLFSLGLFHANSFWPVLFFLTGMTVSHGVVVPVSDAAALHLTAQGRSHIGTLRGLATSGYIVALLATGYLTEWYGGVMFLVVTVLTGALRVGMVILLPNFKTPHDKVDDDTSEGGLGLFLKGWFVLPLFGWALVYATMLALANFLPLVFKGQGLAESTISWLIALGALTETLMFFFFKHIETRLALKTFILISALVAVARWVVMALTPSLPVLVFLQSLHGITYALGFVACISFISRNLPSKVAAEAQGVFVVMQQITAIVMTTAFSGLFGAFGDKAFYASAACAGMGALMIACAPRVTPPAPIAPGRSSGHLSPT